MAMIFEWDPKKALRNLKTHGVSFDEASTVFRDPISITIPDPLHSEDKDRFVLLGYSHRNRLLVVAHTDRGDRTRIISGRPATRKERLLYEENAK